ncbi:MAG: hypothetical protein ABIN74_09940 [Ferruginibacter sp.]
MYKNQAIKKIVAAAMLIVFALSITPTIIFHNWFAGHTDTAKKITDQKDEQVGKQTFNCHCDNIVAESPFTEPAQTIIPPAEQLFSPVKFDKQRSLTNSPNIFHSLRGPPVV